MPASGIKLLDANIWLALAFSGHVHHERAKAWFDGLSDETCAFCRITQMALLRHLTNGGIMGAAVQTQQQAWASYEAFAADPRVMFEIEPAGLEPRFRALTQDATPSHGWWTDSYLAAFAMAGDFELVTLEKNFRPAAGLKLLSLAPSGG